MAKSQAYKDDLVTARAAEIRSETNPFAPGSRPARMFDRLRTHSRNMDALFSEMEAVYGPIGTRRQPCPMPPPAAS